MTHNKPFEAARCFSAVMGMLLALSQGYSAVARQQKTGSAPHKVTESTLDCSDVPYAKELPVGPGCPDELYARRGRPFMFVARDGLAFGISFKPNKPIGLILWVDNQTDKAENFLVCCNSTAFEHIEVSDSTGRRIWSRNDQIIRKARLEGGTTVDACSCSGWVDVPPHTLRILGAAEMDTGYTLPAGHFIISERYPATSGNLDEDETGSPRPHTVGLTISIP